MPASGPGLPALLCMLSAACAGTPPPPAADANPAHPVPQAPQPVIVRAPTPDIPTRRRPPGRPRALNLGDTATDPILTSPSAQEDAIADRVAWWLDYWQTRAADRFVRALVRMGRYEDYIDAELAARGLPPSLRYLPIIEASYYPRADSPAGAGGLWQFMPATARWLGIEVGPLVDQRYDPYVATPRALDYLASLHEQFGSWFLALAAYNGGPGRLRRILSEYESERPWADDVFHRIRHRLPFETRDFIPKYLAAVRLARDPASFGLAEHSREPPQSFDVVAVAGPASIDVIARAAGSGEEEVRLLNPHLVLGLTPAGATTAVRVPRGSGTGFEARFAAIPEGDRVTYAHHRVNPGETLSGIARSYRVSLRDLRAANPEVEPRLLQIGTVLVIPRAPGNRSGTPLPG